MEGFSHHAASPHAQWGAERGKHRVETHKSRLGMQCGLVFSCPKLPSAAPTVVVGLGQALGLWCAWHLQSVSVRMCPCLHVCMCAYACAYKSACMHVCMHVKVCMHLCTYLHVSACVYVCTCLHMCACMSVHVSACLHVYACVYMAKSHSTSVQLGCAGAIWGRLSLSVPMPGTLGLVSASHPLPKPCMGA